ncbi:phage head closure protein [Clostridium sp.]|uniref:phage head closure protein n=1 Tax=Clostridium sp. TaxID=1506 RepID=UPI002632004B|nr:phage head closure protein [Clostridium sp.]
MTYDYELTLISQTIIEDEIGNQIPEEIKTNIYCDLKSIGRNEFYTAAKSGLRPEVVFVIHNYEYSGEKEVLFESKRYKVIRTYLLDFEEVELTCERVV